MTPPLRFRRIVVPMDFSAPARRALALARDLAQLAGPSHVMLVHGYHVPPEIEAFAADLIPSYLERLSEQAAEDLSALLSELQDAGVSAEFFSQAGSPERVILDLARDKEADLIVMGTHGRTGLARAALGSVAARVVRAATCPVIAVGGDSK